MAASSKTVASSVRLALKPPAPSSPKTTQTTTQTKMVKKKKPLIVNRPPAVKPKTRKVNANIAAGVGAKKTTKSGDGFPIPLAFLYRDPRPILSRRLAGGGAGAGGGHGDVSGSGGGGGGGGGGHWDETDGDGLPIKETAEQLREKKTLYAANMAQAQAFQNNYRFRDAESALTKVMFWLLLRLLCSSLFRGGAKKEMYLFFVVESFRKTTGTIGQETKLLMVGRSPSSALMGFTFHVVITFPSVFLYESKFKRIKHELLDRVRKKSPSRVCF